MAAGLGTRLRPITETLPKPLVRVAGRSLIDWVLDRLVAAGVERAVVNTHHLAELIQDHLKDRRDIEILFSHEPAILETGGGVKQALPLLGPEPFVSVNAKILWLNGRKDALERLAETWDDARMDALLLLQPTVDAIGYDGAGDFAMAVDGRIRRRREHEVTPFLFSGVQILHPRLFRDAPDGHFSLNLLYDRAIEAGRLYAIRHDGAWFHVSTPRHLAEVEARLAETGFSR